jgi:hypothetical protein
MNYQQLCEIETFHKLLPGYHAELQFPKTQNIELREELANCKQKAVALHYQITSVYQKRNLDNELI